MVNKGALRSKMRKKQGNKMILCIVAVCEFIGLIVYFTVRKAGKVFEITDISKILDLLRMAVGNLVLSILPAIATLLGLSFGSIVQKVLRARLNWKNRKVVKYRLIKINEVVNYKEDVWNYFRYILETIGIVSCIGIWVGIAKLCIVFFSMNVEIQFGIAIAIVVVVDIITVKLSEKRYILFMLYGVIGSLSILYVVELYLKDSNIIVIVACGSAITISLIIYHMIYHFLLPAKLKILYTYIFIVTRGILLMGCIIGIFVVQQLYLELYSLWLGLLVVEEFCQIWIYKKDLGDIWIKTKNGHVVKVLKNILQYENGKIGFIDYQGREVVCENKIVEYIYYQNKVSPSYGRRIRKKNNEVICFVEGQKDPFVGQKYCCIDDWIYLERVDDKIIEKYFIPVFLVKKIYTARGNAIKPVVRSFVR